MATPWDIKETDIFDYYSDDKETGMIGGYLEGISRGREFIERASCSNKPVVAIKSNVCETTTKNRGQPFGLDDR